MTRFAYPVVVTSDEDDGGFVVTFPDVPEAITQGDTIEECMAEAIDCLEEAIATYIAEGLEIPTPSAAGKGQHMIRLPGLLALKAALHMAIQERQSSNVALGRQLDVDEKEVRRWRDPHHGTKLPTLERALAALGKQVEIQVR